MKNYNICKRNLNRSSDLICENFIYETEKAQSEPHVAESNVINIVVSGSGRLVCNGKVYRVSEGMMFFILREDRFSIDSEGELEYFYISFHGRRANEYFERLGIDENNRLFNGFEELIPFWKDAMELSEDGNIDMLTEAVLLYSMARLQPQRREKGDVISKIITMTHEIFTEHTASLSVIAEELGYDAKYLSSVFKKKKGIGYSEYLRDLRIKRAVFLMENGVVSVKNVALLSGFHDAQYFSKVFVKLMGISPSEYIERISVDSE